MNGIAMLRSRFRGGDSVSRQLVRYALPSIVGMLIVGVQTFVDGIFVAKGVGPLGLAAVNLSMPIINVMLSVTIMIISGGIVLCGIAKGGGDQVAVRGLTSLTFVVLVATVLLMSALVFAFLRPLCYALGANEEVYPFVRQYLGFIGTAFLFYCIPNFTEAFTRLNGRPNWVFLSGVICCGVNILLDYLFVLRLGWGVRGAAVATCAANSTAALVLSPNVHPGRLRGGWREVGRMFYNGSSEMLTSVSAAVAMYLFNLVLMRESGPLGVAALTIVCYLNFAVNMSIFGLSQALYPLMSYQLGARSYGGIRSLLRSSMALSACIGVGIYLLCLIFKSQIIGVFAAGDVTLATLTRSAISLVTLHYLVSFVNIVASSFHTAVERPVESAAVALCRSIVFVVLPLVLLVPRVGLTGVWLCMPVAEVLTLSVSLPLMARTMGRLRLRLR